VRGAGGGLALDSKLGSGAVDAAVVVTNQDRVDAVVAQMSKIRRATDPMLHIEWRPGRDGEITVFVFHLRRLTLQHFLTLLKTLEQYCIRDMQVIDYGQKLHPSADCVTCQRMRPGVALELSFGPITAAAATRSLFDVSTEAALAAKEETKRFEIAAELAKDLETLVPNKKDWTSIVKVLRAISKNPHASQSISKNPPANFHQVCADISSVHKFGWRWVWSFYEADIDRVSPDQVIIDLSAWRIAVNLKATAAAAATVAEEKEDDDPFAAVERKRERSRSPPPRQRSRSRGRAEQRERALDRRSRSRSPIRRRSPSPVRSRQWSDDEREEDRKRVGRSRSRGRYS